MCYAAKGCSWDLHTKTPELGATQHPRVDPHFSYENRILKLHERLAL